MMPIALATNLPYTVRLPQTVPVASVAPANVSLTAGLSHSLARRFDGTVWAWGANASSQLGDGTTTNRLVPTQIPVFEGVAAVAAGASHSLAVKDDGTVWSWGNNGAGRLGRSGDTTRPGQVAALSGMIAVSGVEPIPWRYEAPTAPSGRGAPTPPASWATAPPTTARLRCRCRVSPASPRWRQARTTRWR